MAKWTGPLIAAEMRWAVLRPTSRGYSALDPANHLRSSEDLLTGRRVIREWLDELAEHCRRHDRISAAELSAWRARFHGSADDSPASTRTYRVGRVARAIARVLPTVGPELAAPRPQMYRAPRSGPVTPERGTGGPRSDAQRAATSRRRRNELAAAVEASPGQQERRTRLLMTREEDPPFVTAARLRAGEAADGGSAADLATALRELYDLLNNQERLDASTAARWSAEMSPTRSIQAYEMYNADLGVLARHERLALDGQLVWAQTAMLRAYRLLDVPRLAPEVAHLVEVRHAERVAQILVAQGPMGSRSLRAQDVQASEQHIRQLATKVVDGDLVGVDPGWQAVVLQRRIDLALFRLNPAALPHLAFDLRERRRDISRAIADARAAIDHFGGALPDLRKAQLSRLTAKAARRVGRTDLTQEWLAEGYRHAQGLPGQLRQLAEVNRLLPPELRIPLP